jgi:hypothetical protein
MSPMVGALRVTARNSQASSGPDTHEPSAVASTRPKAWSLWSMPFAASINSGGTNHVPTQITAAPT